MSNTLGARYLEAWNSHDPARVGDFMADDVDFEDVTLGEVLRGRKEVMDFVDRFSETFSTDYRFDLQTELATDATLALEWVVEGTHDRTSPALPATNRAFGIRGATIARIADGRITYNRDYWDMAGFLQQVGVLPSAETP
jgi:steroid delta-isomerase-like uncharacterized protein